MLTVHQAENKRLECTVNNCCVAGRCVPNGVCSRMERSLIAPRAVASGVCASPGGFSAGERARRHPNKFRSAESLAWRSLSISRSALGRRKPFCAQPKDLPISPLWMADRRTLSLNFEVECISFFSTSQLMKSQALNETSPCVWRIFFKENHAGDKIKWSLFINI